ncbi:hypothetical protein JCM11491_006071 [Sporobolomyces phaffii]
MMATLVILTLVSTVFADTAVPAPTDALPRLDIIYNLEPAAAEEMHAGMVELMMEGYGAHRQLGDACVDECATFASDIEGCIGDIARNETTGNDPLLCMCAPRVLAEAPKCGACFDDRDRTVNYRKDAQGWIDMCDTVLDKLSKLSTFSSLQARTSPTALATATTRLPSDALINISLWTSTYSDIFSRGGRPTDPGTASATALSTQTPTRDSGSPATPSSKVIIVQSTNVVTVPGTTASGRDPAEQENAAGSGWNNVPVLAFILVPLTLFYSL